MNKYYKEAAEICAKSPAIRAQVMYYIKHGRGYSDPTDLYDDLDFDKVPKKYHKYFSESEDEEDFSEVEANPLIGCLYTRDGTIALFDAVVNFKGKTK